MAYVNVPKDLTRVKNKIAFNMTKRQLICLGIADDKSGVREI